MVKLHKDLDVHSSHQRDASGAVSEYGDHGENRVVQGGDPSAAMIMSKMIHGSLHAHHKLAFLPRTSLTK